MVPGLIDTATVRTTDPATGRFTVVARTGLRCRLLHLTRQPAGGGGAAERAELAAGRALLWDEDYTLPEPARVEANGDGVPWQVVANTEGAFRGPSGAVVYRRAELVRADR